MAGSKLTPLHLLRNFVSFPKMPDFLTWDRRQVPKFEFLWVRVESKISDFQLKLDFWFSKPIHDHKQPKIWNEDHFIFFKILSGFQKCPTFSCRFKGITTKSRFGCYITFTLLLHYLHTSWGKLNQNINQVIWEILNKQNQSHAIL